ncbi:hypothetical protein B7463_g5302, partial [Scytalidium lignicola]
MDVTENDITPLLNGGIHPHPKDDDEHDDTAGFCEMVIVAPFINLFEQSLCRTYYSFPSGKIDDALCKIPEIQAPLATIRGWKSTFDTLAVILVGIPFGKLGDRYGLRKTLAVAVVGVIFSLSTIFVVCAFPKVLPLRLVWLSSVFILCGGGLPSAVSFMWAMVSESIPLEWRRRAFYYVFSAFYVAELVASFVAATTTDISSWIPCGLALVSLLLCLLLLWIMPDSRSSGHYLESQAEPGNDANDTANTSGLPAKTALIDSFKSILFHRNILLTLPTFLVVTLRYTTLNILIQYASIRFGFKISAGATFYTESAVINLVLFLLVMPRLNAYIQSRYKIKSQNIDLNYVRISVCLLCIGSLLIGLAPSGRLLPLGVFVFSGGFGSRVHALALATHWIAKDFKATFYTAIAVLENIGHMLGDPAMQQIFAATLRATPFWHALPFFVAAALYLIAMIATAFVKIDEDNSECLQEES